MNNELMTINMPTLKGMTDEQLAHEFQQQRRNIGFALLGMGAILVERKSRPYEGDFKNVIRDEFGFSPSRGYLLMKAWNERDSFIEKVQSTGLNYSRLETILAIPANDRGEFIEEKHPETMTQDEARAAVREYREMQARLTDEIEARQQAEGRADSLELELLHKQSEVDALKHENEMAAEQAEQVLIQDSPDTLRIISRLKIELEQEKEKSKEIDFIRADNERLKRENARFWAHEEGKTYREKAAIDATLSGYKDNFVVEAQNSKRLSNLFSATIWSYVKI